MPRITSRALVVAGALVAAVGCSVASRHAPRSCESTAGASGDDRTLVLIEDSNATPEEPSAPPSPPVVATATPAASLPAKADARREARVPTPGPSLAKTAPRKIGQGTLVARDENGAPLGELPLRHTDVDAQVSGFLASTRVVQTFVNSFDRAIEAVYVFPLPESAAVNDFVMVAGDRRVRGLVRPRAEAERIYREARRRGHVASLLTQERPNVFTQSIANLPPKEEVRVEITYVETLRYEAGEYSWAFPMVVGPRFMPSHAEPPTLAEGERSGHDVSLRVALDAGVPLREVVVPTHDCAIERTSDARATVTLRKSDAIANRDLVLRWKVAGSEPEVGLLAHRGEEGGFFSLLLQPQVDPGDAFVTPREITFLIDVSGSQQGLPLAMSKRIVAMCLDRLRPRDRFNVLYFESGNGALYDRPVANTPEHVAEAKEFVSRLSGGGGTQMLEGLRRALREPRDPQYLGMVVFFTDGYVGNDQEILRLVKSDRGNTRIFVFGTGGSVNRALLSSIADVGGGKVEYALPRDVEFADRCVESFFSAIDSPVLCDIDVDWGELAVRDVYPARVRDLFAGQPIALTGRYVKGGTGTVTVRGRTGSRRVERRVTVTLPESEPAHAALAPIWARRRIDDLSEQLLVPDARVASIEKEITQLACEFRLASPYTAFVAVDESRVVSNGQPARIDQPVELPEGVSREGVGR